MALPEHLEPKTYWEARMGIAEEALQQLANVLSPHLPHSANMALEQWQRDWMNLLVDLREKHPPLPAPPGEKP